VNVGQYVRIRRVVDIRIHPVKIRTFFPPFLVQLYGLNKQRSAIGMANRRSSKVRLALGPERFQAAFVLLPIAAAHAAKT
jgi:hypothetical protein